MHNAADCPRCKKATRVIETRRSGSYVRRARECESCGTRYCTVEVAGEAAEMARLHQEAEALNRILSLPPEHREVVRQSLCDFVDWLLPFAQALRETETLDPSV